MDNAKSVIESDSPTDNSFHLSWWADSDPRRIEPGLGTDQGLPVALACAGVTVLESGALSFIDPSVTILGEDSVVDQSPSLDRTKKSLAVYGQLGAYTVTTDHSAATVYVRVQFASVVPTPLGFGPIVDHRRHDDLTGTFLGMECT
jgi:hypothetical protein